MRMLAHLVERVHQALGPFDVDRLRFRSEDDQTTVTKIPEIDNRVACFFRRESDPRRRARIKPESNLGAGRLSHTLLRVFIQPDAHRLRNTLHPDEPVAGPNLHTVMQLDILMNHSCFSN